MENRFSLSVAVPDAAAQSDLNFLFAPRLALRLATAHKRRRCENAKRPRLTANHLSLSLSRGNEIDTPGV